MYNMRTPSKLDMGEAGIFPGIYPGNTKTINSNIKPWNSNEFSRLLSQTVFLPASSQVGSQAQPCPACCGEGYQF